MIIIYWFPFSYTGGKTATGLALQAANKLFKDAKSGARQGTKRVVFVLTDGKSNLGVRPYKAAKALELTTKASIYAFGVGYRITTWQLKNIALSWNGIFRVHRYSDLKKVVALLHPSKSTLSVCSGFQ